MISRATTLGFFRFQAYGGLQKHPKCYRSKGVSQRKLIREQQEHLLWELDFLILCEATFWSVGGVTFCSNTKTSTSCAAPFSNWRSKLTVQQYDLFPFAVYRSKFIDLLMPYSHPVFIPTMAGKCNTNLDKVFVTLCPSPQQNALFQQWDLIMSHLPTIFTGITKYGTKEL